MICGVLAKNAEERRREEAKIDDGQRRPQKRAKTERHETEVYMDDRTVVANSPAPLIQGVQWWEEWSTGVGLHENAGKKQLIGKSTELRNMLKEHLKVEGLGSWGKLVGDQAEVLGVTVGDHRQSEDCVGGLMQCQFRGCRSLGIRERWQGRMGGSANSRSKFRWMQHQTA